MSDKMKKGLVFALILVVIILLVSVLYLLKRNGELKSEISVSQTPAMVSIVALSPDSSATATKTTTSTAIATQTPSKSKIDLIKEALASKLSVPLSQVSATISKESDSSAFGSVSTSEEGGGGWFVAAKSGDAWVIVEDGNGTIDCAPLANYNIPTSVVAECWDTDTQSLKQR